MKKITALMLAGLLLTSLALPVLSADDDPDKEELFENNLAKDSVKLEKLALDDIQVLKSCILSKDFNGTQWAFIRLMPGQYKMIRIKASFKKTSVVPIRLYPRQRYAIRIAAGLSAQMPPVTLKVSEKNIYSAKTLKGYYVYRKLDLIKQISAGQQPYVEPTEPADKPSAIYF